MKIKEIQKDKIIFDNGNELWYEHEQDCCENVYADFEQMQIINKNYYAPTNSNLIDFNPDTFLQDIKLVEGIGFIIRGKSSEYNYEDFYFNIFVSCYNEQNGYYSDELILKYKNGINILSINITNCEGQYIY